MLQVKWPFSNSNQSLGFLIIIFSVISFLSLYVVTIKIADQAHISCESTHGNVGCTVLGHVPYESFLGLGGLSFLGVMGTYIVFKEERKVKASSKMTKTISDTVKNLDDEEKSVYNQIESSDGFIFQNDLIQKTGFSKVKVSRLLDKLEAKNLVERRRRGMSNIVVTKD